MILKDIYAKPIERKVNPAVSVTLLDDPETTKAEIREYVFTDEIINGLYRILNSIRDNKSFHHVGIWIDGYYGSGKSHFLKYLDYCIDKRTQEEALARLSEAVNAIDFMDGSHNIEFNPMDLSTLINWLRRATIDTIPLNLETSHNQSVDKSEGFLHVFWNQFNGLLGLNPFHLWAARHLEKPLLKKGKFEEFKQIMKEEMNADWDNQTEAASIIDNELEAVLEVAKGLVPTLDTNNIYERISRRDSLVSIETFADELADYLADKGEDYRLLFLADAVSQFINQNRDRYLNLQEIVTKLAERCDNKIWVACTAQQDLSEIISGCNINDDEGKIKGRFEVIVSFKGKNSDYITQKRILDKKEEVKDDLRELYKKNKDSFSVQFKLPRDFDTYTNVDDFINFYPFQPYQLKLIKAVFDSFLSLGYVAREVKGTERSVIKVVHATAKEHANDEVGGYITFDELYNNMFSEGLQHSGHKIVDRGISMVKNYDGDKKLARRVVNVLFMVSNLSESDKLLFPATLDFITSLLVENVSAPRLTLKKEVEKVLDFLCESNVIRREQPKKNIEETFAFYTEEEMKVASVIKSQQVDHNTQAEQLSKIFLKYFSNLKNREVYVSRSFPISASIVGRTFLSNNGDVTVDFKLDNEGTPDEVAFRNTNSRLIFYLGPAFRENKRLQAAFHDYCQVMRYLATPATSEENDRIRDEFRKRTDIQKETVIDKEFHKLLDSCPVIIGNELIDDPTFSSCKGAERCSVALTRLFDKRYSKAVLVKGSSIPDTNEKLKTAIRRPVQNGEYEFANADLTPAEKEIEIYLNNQYGDVTVSDIVAHFADAPWGWDSLATLYVLNELVRRHYRDYSYNNNQNVDIATVASKIISESSRFTVRKAETISRELVNKFLDAWKYIFGQSSYLHSTDSTQIFREAKGSQESDSGLFKFCKQYRDAEKKYGHYPFFAPVVNALEMFDSLDALKDPKTFFEKVVDLREDAHNLMDTVRQVLAFTRDQMENYKDILAFIRDNRENFNLLDDKYKEKVTEIMGLESQPWPVVMSDYLDLKDDLTVALDKIRKQLRDEIKAAYEKAYAELVQGAKDSGVDESVVTNPENIIFSKSQTGNIYALQSNRNVDEYFTAQAAKIQKAKLAAAKAASAANGGGATSGTGASVGTGASGYSTDYSNGSASHAAEPKVMNLNLVTRTTAVLSNETEVDAYLSSLKKQMMDKINDGWQLTITQ